VRQPEEEKSREFRIWEFGLRKSRRAEDKKLRRVEIRKPGGFAPWREATRRAEDKKIRRAEAERGRRGEEQKLRRVAEQKGICPGGTDEYSPVIDRWERKKRS
jgi:hypothetical protein